MNAEEIVRKWKDDETADSPAGAIELTNDELTVVNGASPDPTWRPTCSFRCYTHLTVLCHNK